MVHSLSGHSSLRAHKHSALFSGCCPPAHAKVPRGTLMRKAIASGKYSPAGHLPKLRSGCLLPEALPAQQLQGPGEAACCQAHNSSCTRTGLPGQSLGRHRGLRNRARSGKTWRLGSIQRARAKRAKHSEVARDGNGHSRGYLTRGMGRQGCAEELARKRCWG